METVFDWIKIKAEYVTGNISFRNLAKKYKCSYSTLQKRATREDWVSDKEKHTSEVVAKSVAKIESQQVARASRIIDIANKILDKMEKSVDMIDPCDRQGFRYLTAALKDIKEIQMVKSEADLREQEARIAQLQKSIKTDETSNEVTIRIEGGDDFTE